MSAEIVPPRTDDLGLDDLGEQAQLLEQLNVLYVRADRPSYRDLESRARGGGYELSRNAVSRIITSREFPRREKMIAFLVTCGVPPKDVKPWVRAWERVVQQDPPAWILADRSRQTAAQQLRVELRGELEAEIRADLRAQVHAEAKAEVEAEVTAWLQAQQQERQAERQSVQELQELLLQARAEVKQACQDLSALRRQTAEALQATADRSAAMLAEVEAHCRGLADQLRKAIDQKTTADARTEAAEIIAEARARADVIHRLAAQKPDWIRTDTNKPTPSQTTAQPPPTPVRSTAPTQTGSLFPKRRPADEVVTFSSSYPSSKLGAGHYHRSDCKLVKTNAGFTRYRTSRTKARSQGALPCPTCHPDG